MQPPHPNLSTPSRKEAKADWSCLPPELLEQISERLNSEIYIFRFRSVCSWWRDCTPRYPNNHSSWELPEFPDSDEVFYVRRLSKQHIYLIKPPQHQQTLCPWLIRIGRDLNGNLHLWHPFDGCQSSLLFAPFYLARSLIDFNHLPVLDLEHKFRIHEADSPDRYVHDGKVIVATGKGGGKPLDLMTYDNFQELKILRYGVGSWKSIPTIERSLWGDICIFKGKLCVADKNGRTVMIESDYSVHLLANPVYGAEFKFLVVESECVSLLLVDCHGLTSADEDGIRFDVFRLDEKNKRWIKLRSLENRVLFMGDDCSFCVSASNLCIGNGNCIIYSRDYNFHSIEQVESRMRIFHLDQDRVSPLSDYPDYFKLFWPPPEWIVEHHS
ncbi:unnamed protein product [Vicia faba]|uniref:F-box domain-containing protein n=1 Tax=Vicia faba TaxID=3906 RepID=A0AAV0ZGZ3_VICFA|nr:unnamed protein product [Vicia faba]